MSKSSRAPEGNERGPKRHREEETNLCDTREKVKRCLLSRMKDVENPVGLFSTELKAYKVRGVKAASRR